MKLARADVIPLRLPLTRVLTLPRGASRSLDEGKRLLLVRVESDDGRVGWGEASPSRRWSAETLESALTSLETYLIPAALGRDPADPAGLHAALDAELAPGFDQGQPIAKAALDFACYDLVAQAAGVPVQALLGPRAPGRITLAYLVSAPTPEAAAAQVQAARAQGYAAFKVKVGGHPPAHDVAVARAVVRAAGGGTVWVDANQGYDAAAAREAARGFEALGLEVFEQPVAVTDWEGLRALRRATPLTIALDEAAMSPARLGPRYDRLRYRRPETPRCFWTNCAHKSRPSRQSAASSAPTRPQPMMMTFIVLLLLGLPAPANAPRAAPRFCESDPGRRAPAETGPTRPNTQRG